MAICRNETSLGVSQDLCVHRAAYYLTQRHFFDPATRVET